MRKIFLLAAANVRAAKGYMLILVLLFLIAALMLNLGLSVLTGFGPFFGRMAEELNTSDVHFRMSEEFFTDEVEEFFVGQSSEFEIGRSIFVVPSLEWDGEMQERRDIAFRDREEVNTLSQWTLLGDSLPEGKDTIYVPYRYYVVGGYELGDEIAFELDEETLRFTIAGFSEDIFSDFMTGIPDTLFISPERFSELYETYECHRSVLVFANGMNNTVEAEYGLLQFIDISQIGAEDARHLMSSDLERTALSRTDMAAMTGVVMLIFTLIVAAVSLLVIRFRVKDSIEDDMPKIGSLQAIGYTSPQIANSFTVQYGTVVLLASFVAILPAQLLLPSLAAVLAEQSGLNWQPEFDATLSLGIAFALVAIVTLTTWLSAKKIRKINPVVALRGGIANYSFKRNMFPLDRSRLPRTLALSCKSVFQGAKQSLMMFVILVAVAFVASISIILYYNSAINLSTFEQIPGIERANVVAGIGLNKDPDSFAGRVIALPDVRDAQYLDHGRITVEDTHVSVIVMDDYARRVTNNVYEGIFPRHNNEIAIAGALALQLDKNIGDEIIAASGESEARFLITGFSQGMEHGDVSGVYLTRGGMNRIDADFWRMALAIYLYPSANTDIFIAELEDAYGDYLTFAADIDADFEEGVSGFASIFAAIGLVLLISASLVVALILYFVIGSTVVRRYRELGIQKAIGYTTGNLMSQISLSFALPILLGVTVGCILGAMSLNPLMGVAGAEMGMMSANFIVNVQWVAGTGILTVVLAYLVSILATLRIRKISAYSLIVE